MKPHRWSAEERIDAERDGRREGFLWPALLLLGLWAAVYAWVLFLGVITEPMGV